MSLHILATGRLIADPVRRTGAKGDFTTALLRVATDDGAILASVIAFGAAAESLLAHRAGATLAVAGRAELTSWTGRDGAENHGLSMVAEQIASASGARRADVERRRGRLRVV
jgi:single-stranded DNA-binding protein